MTTQQVPTGTGDPSQHTVLIADDEDLVRHVLAQMLMKLGCRVLTAINGAEAMTIFDKHADEIDLVIFDLTMPQMDGTELFANLKKQSPEVKTLLTSGQDDLDSISDMRDAGLSGFIRKPFTLSDIKSAVLNLIGTD